MKRILIVTALTIAAASLTVGQTPDKKAAQDKPIGEKVAASSTVEQELIKLDKDWSEASRRGDTAALEQIMAAEHTGTNPSGKVSTRAEAVAQAKAAAGIPSQDSTTSDDHKVQVYGDTAVLTHRNTVSGTKDGQPFTNQSRTVHVFVKRDGRWQAVFSQSSPIAAQQQPAQPQATQPPAERKP